MARYLQTHFFWAIPVCLHFQKYLSSRCAWDQNLGSEGQNSAVANDFRFGSKAKMSRSAHHFFPTFYLFPGRFSYTLQHIKKLEYPFYFSAKYGLFSLSTWSKNKNFALDHKTSIIHFLKINNFYFMVKVKIFIF